MLSPAQAVKVLAVVHKSMKNDDFCIDFFLNANLNVLLRDPRVGPVEVS
jgi:hypothetical protein